MVGGATLCLGNSCDGDGDGREEQELAHDEFPCRSRDEKDEIAHKRFREIFLNLNIFVLKYILCEFGEFRLNLYDPNE